MYCDFVFVHAASNFYLTLMITMMLNYLFDLVIWFYYHVNHLMRSCIVFLSYHKWSFLFLGLHLFYV